MIKRVLVIVIALTLFGCGGGPGLLFTERVVPYTKDFKSTPIGAKKCIVNSYDLKEPVTQAGVRVQWDADIMAEAAHRAGISDIHYIDKRTLSILFGLYKKDSFIIYGD